MKYIQINRQCINLLPCQVLLHSMHITSLYGLKLSVLRGVGAKALATDHRVVPIGCAVTRALSWLNGIFLPFFKPFNVFTWTLLICINYKYCNIYQFSTVENPSFRLSQQISCVVLLIIVILMSITLLIILSIMIIIIIVLLLYRWIFSPLLVHSVWKIYWYSFDLSPL